MALRGDHIWDRSSRQHRGHDACEGGRAALGVEVGRHGSGGRRAQVKLRQAQSAIKWQPFALRLQPAIHFAETVTSL